MARSLLTDAFDPLFPAAAGLSVCAIAAGIGQLRRRPTATAPTGRASDPSRGDPVAPHREGR